MRIAGLLQPGTTLGYVVDSKFVKAGLIVVQTIEERDKIVQENKGALVQGTPIYVAGTKKTYRYNEQQSTFSVEPSFREDENGVLCIENEDGSLSKVKVEVGLNDLDPTLKDEIENLPSQSEVESLISSKLQDYVTLNSLTSMITDIESRIDLKQDRLTAGTGIKIEDNVISAIYTGIEQIKFATKAQFPIAGEEDKLYVAKDEKQIYIWDSVSSNYASVSGGTLTPDIDIINGGTASPII